MDKMEFIAYCGERGESTETDGYLPLSQKALNRMHKAYKEGRGCRLSWEELEEFSRTIIGEWWNTPVDIGK